MLRGHAMLAWSKHMKRDTDEASPWIHTWGLRAGETRVGRTCRTNNLSGIATGTGLYAQ
jgi:hypothetical protein